MVRTTLALATFTTLVIFMTVGCAEQEPVTDPAIEALLNSAGMMNTPFITEGVRLPPHVDGQLAELDPDTRIIGVVVDGQARAYSIPAMSVIQTHVINDRIAQKPISVIYCDRTDCARVVTAEDVEDTIPLFVGGFADNELLLRLNEQMYGQTSAELPLTDFDFEQSTWEHWLKKHPNTQIMMTATASAEDSREAPEPDPVPDAAGGKSEADSGSPAILTPKSTE